MINKIISFFKENKLITRLLFLFVIPMIILISIDQIDILISSIKAIIVLYIFIFITFLTVKFIFPYIDIKELYLKSVTTSNGASVVLMSFILFLSILIYSIFNILFK